MKTVYTHTGWDEIVTKHYKVESVSSKPLMTVFSWVQANQNIGVKNRTCCHRCKTRWADIHGISSVWVVFTDKGSKTVCDTCKEQVDIQLNALTEDSAAFSEFDRQFHAAGD